MITKKQILTEASKTKILVDKLGLDQTVAERINAICGSLSVWLANKLLITVAENIFNGDLDMPDIKAKSIEFMNKRISVYSSVLTNIMDYIRVGLNSDISTVKNFSYSRLNDMANEWHEGLHIGNDAIDYTEEHPIIRDYRKDGIGFYWVDLETHYCDEESERMGHCGRTGGNTLYSLRQYKPLTNGHTLNSSHITAAIDGDGEILQMKGQKNSKPKAEYHPYIIDLLLNDEDLTGFGYEYDSENDFKISDLTEEQIRNIYAKRPELFSNRKGKRMLQKLGIIEKNPDDGNFVLKMDPDDIYRYVDGAWNVGKRKTQSGGTRDVDIFEALLTDPWSHFEYYIDQDISMVLDYYVNDENEAKIKEILVKYAKQQDYEIDPADSLEDIIKELDDDYEISNAITGAQADCETNSSIDHYTETLKDALITYGNITKFDETGVEINCNIYKIAQEMGVTEDDLDEYIERCGDDDLPCVVTEIAGDYDKPSFSIDDRWTPDVDEKDFNEMLADRLADINVPEETTVNEQINKMKNMINKLL